MVQMELMQANDQRMEMAENMITNPDEEKRQREKLIRFFFLLK